MAVNNFFQFYTTTLGAKSFRAFFDQDVIYDGRTNVRILEEAVTGASLLTRSSSTKTRYVFMVKFDGTESGAYGTYSDLINYYKAGVITFKHWDTSITDMSMVIASPAIEPLVFEPFAGIKAVPIELVEFVT